MWSFCLAFCLYFAVSFSTTLWYILRISGRIACKFTDSWESQRKAQWEAQLPNGLCIGLRVERPGFETWPRLCVVFLEKTLCSHSASLKGTLNLETRSIVCSISSWWKRLKEKRNKRDKKKRLDRTILSDNHAKVSQVIDHSDQSFLNVDHE